MKTLKLMLCAALLAGPIALNAQHDADGDPGPKPVLRAEATQEVERDFDRHDTNHDGYLSAAEWDKSNEGDPDLTGAGQLGFGKMDTDDDKRLSKQEVKNWVLGLFDCIDENRDAEVTNQELDQGGERCMKAAGINMIEEGDPEEQAQSTSKTARRCEGESGPCGTNLSALP